MRIAVLADDEQWNELIKAAKEKYFVRISSLQQVKELFDACIILNTVDIEQFSIQTPVLVNSVTHTLRELNSQPNVLRINGWNGFLLRKSWEIAGVITDKVQEIFVALDKEYIEAADEPGFIAARIIAMIINEAYFALGENISTKNEIDIAMKLGTNYPFGPFEWGEKIGVDKIYELLLSLSKFDKRYLPATLLQQEATI